MRTQSVSTADRDSRTSRDGEGARDGDEGARPDEHASCGRVRPAVDARRTPAQREEAAAAAEALRRETPRRVPLRDLVAFMRPVPGHGAPTDLLRAHRQDEQIAMLLCDPLTREWVSRNYLAAHPDVQGGRP